MTITTTNSETYEQQQLDPVAAVQSEVATDNCSPLSCPKMFWAGIAVFVANLAVVGGVMLSPELRVGLYGDDSPSAYTASADKPSPFTLVVDESKPRKVKLAQHVRPIVFEEPVMADNFTSSVELAVPRASQAAAVSTAYTTPSSKTITGNAVYRQVESYGDFRRVTAASQDLIPPTPRRVTN